MLREGCGVSERGRFGDTCTRLVSFVPKISLIFPLPWSRFLAEVSLSSSSRLWLARGRLAAFFPRHARRLAPPTRGASCALDLWRPNVLVWLPAETSPCSAMLLHGGAEERVTPRTRDNFGGDVSFHPGNVQRTRRMGRGRVAPLDSTRKTGWTPCGAGNSRWGFVFA